MLPRKRLIGHHVAPSAKGAHASLYLMCAMMLFWTLSEGIVSFIVPIKIEEAGMSDTMMGIILGTSSIAGALFDLIACRLFKDTYYKRIFGVMLALSVLFPLILLQAEEMLVFVMAMIVWGVYYDLKNIGNFDYIARTVHKKDHSHSFGMIQIAQSLGWIAGPIIVGFLVGNSLGWKPFAAIFAFLSIAILCFIGLIFATGKKKEHIHNTETKTCRRGTWSEVRLLGTLGKAIFPALVVIFFLNLFDAFFWSIGPLYAELIAPTGWAGVFMTAASLPALFMGWFAGKITKRFGQEGVSYVVIGIGSLIMTAMFFIQTFIAIIGTVFIASLFTSIAWPAIQGAFADYISEREDLDKEIEGLEDFYTNIGYVVGPISAGFLADTFGYGPTFGVLGIIGVVISLLLLLFARKSINLAKSGPPVVCDV